VTYVPRIPRQIPAGLVLVHNHVRPAHPPGMNGFRIWLQSQDEQPEVERCHCDWASVIAEAVGETTPVKEVAEHYRVAAIWREIERLASTPSAG
jgi:hypothetical protein